MSPAPQVRIAATARARLRGLLFRDPGWLGEGGLLLLVPCASVHTFLMRFEIDIAFVGPDGTVQRSERGVSPGRVRSCHGAVAAVERFARPDLPWFAEGSRLCLGELRERAMREPPSREEAGAVRESA